MPFTKLYAIALTALSEKKGAAMVEYGLLVALIAVAAVTIIGTLGGQVNTAFTTISNKL